MTTESNQPQQFKEMNNSTIQLTSSQNWPQEQQQQVPLQPEAAEPMKAVTKTAAKQKPPAKLRRSRQAKNPQDSVARRNERERKRVQSVNNGFAKLRDSLPAASILASFAGSAAASSDSGSAYGDATLDMALGSPCSSKSHKSSSAQDKSSANQQQQQTGSNKKFSKVETLRAAVQYIKRLQEILEETADDTASSQWPTLEGSGSGPLSCASQASNGSSSTHSSSIYNQNSQLITATNSSSIKQQYIQSPKSQSIRLTEFAGSLQWPAQENQSSCELKLELEQQRHQAAIQQQHQQQHQMHSINLQSEQFIKLEPLNSNQSNNNTIPMDQYQQPTHIQLPQMMSPESQQSLPASQYSTTSSNSSSSINAHPHSPLAAGPVHAPNPNHQHTHIWIEQHQSSFMEQQSTHVQAEASSAMFEPEKSNEFWLQQQQQTSNQYLASDVSQASPCRSSSASTISGVPHFASQLQQTTGSAADNQTSANQQQQHQHQHQQQYDAWSYSQQMASMQQHSQQQHQQLIAGQHEQFQYQPSQMLSQHQHLNQISLYSQ